MDPVTIAGGTNATVAGAQERAHAIVAHVVVVVVFMSAKKKRLLLFELPKLRWDVGFPHACDRGNILFLSPGESAQSKH